MSATLIEDRRASRAEIVSHRAELKTLAAERGLTNLRVRADGAIIVTSSAPGYWHVAGFIDAASAVVGAYVYVVTDDVATAVASSTAL